VSVNRTLDLVVRLREIRGAGHAAHRSRADPSGIVSAVGPGVTRAQIGDRVVSCSSCVRQPTSLPAIIAVHGLGRLRRIVKVPAETTLAIPAGVDSPPLSVVARHAPPRSACCVMTRN